MKPKRRLLLVASAAALVFVGLAALLSRRNVQLYKVTVLPSLGGIRTRPEAINDRGQVVGFSEIVGGNSHLFLWDRENGMQDLGPKNGGDVDINNAGQIAGTMTDPNGNRQAFVWDLKDGKQMLGTLDCAESIALGINNRGQVVGTLYPVLSRPPRTKLTWQDFKQAFIWDERNGMQKLFASEQPGSGAGAINDTGQVIGFIATFKYSWHEGPCFWESTDPAVAHVPPLQSPVDYPGGTDLNNNGYVLGKGYHWDKDEEWAYLWSKKTGMEYLFQLENSAGSLKFNDANQVLYGEKHTSSLERFSKKYFGPYTQRCLWDPKRGRIVLDNQVPREMGELLHVRAINNQGCIVGVIRSRGLGNERGILLEPIAGRWAK